MRKLFASSSLLAVTLALVVGVTVAYYGDVETSSGNVFAAGEVDLGIDNSSYYNGDFWPDTSWLLTYDFDDEFGPGPDGQYLFFNFLDLKPGDWGEDTISLHIKDNDAWACMKIDLSETDDNGLTEPEEGDGDTTGGIGEGELQNEIKFVWWADDGDNVLETDEGDSIFSESLLLGLQGLDVTLADSTGNGVLSSGPLLGTGTYYIGKAWCFGEFIFEPQPQDGPVQIGGNGYPLNGPDSRPAGITCDGSGVDNTTQTDSVVGDITFTVAQSRSNTEFICGDGGIGCLEKADVMLVLDRSGSISSSELATLKAAAKSFVDALAPSADGIHVGMVSFATSATLDKHLTGDGADVKAAIDLLSSGGLTNTSAAISTADAELDNPGDGHDRLDVDSPDIMVIITDGEPTTGGGKPAAEVAADAAKLDGIEIFGVGVGISVVNATWMKDEIVSPPPETHYFDAGSFGDLSAILDDLATCE